VLAASAAGAAPWRLSIGVQFPITGIDGGEGDRMREAADVAAQDLRSKDLAVHLVGAAGAQAVQNPHQDEGSDNQADVAAGPAQIRALASQDIHVIVGPLRSNVAVAESTALARARSVAITGTAGEPSEPDSRVFKLGPSDRQLAAAARKFMLQKFGPRICVLSDGTRKARREAAAFLAQTPASPRALLSNPRAIARCAQGADGVYLTALAAPPVFCSAQTARRAGTARLLAAMSLRSFDPLAFAGAGALWRARPVSIPRTPAADAVNNRYHARAFVRADDDALRTYAAVQVAAQAFRREQGGYDPSRVMRATAFHTLIGTVRFERNGDRVDPPIQVARIN